MHSSVFTILLKLCLKGSNYSSRQLVALKGGYAFGYFELLVFAALLIIALLLFRDYRRSKKSKHSEVRARQVEAKEFFRTVPALDPTLEADILKLLVKLEQRGAFLDRDMRLSKIAGLLDTNPKYAAQVIAKYRGKGIVDYLNDLKVTHAVRLLTSESKYRQYTQKALSNEVGFGSSRTFARAFKETTGLSLAEFTAKLDR